ncbi:MAG: response regulator [Pedobacter sp.]|nr:MAG: response regulator [Pedobacter sp.]
MEKTILIVEDDSAILDMLDSALSENFNVQLIGNPEQLEYHLANYLPDLFLIDYGLPYKNGFLISKELKADERTKHIPVILFSANRISEIVLRESHCDGFIQKPFDIWQLEMVLKKHL